MNKIISASAKVKVRAHEYHDSVRLMQVSEQVRRLDGVNEAILMMGTDNNKKLLSAAGLSTRDIELASRDDLIIGIVAETDEKAQSALTTAEELLRKGFSQIEVDEYGSLESAVEALPNANLALISIPGEYAAEESMKALQQGLNVMLFSDNVPIEEEVRLKQFASRNGLLLMGPDCGTAIIGGCGLGFANAVSQGDIGIVGASGTGIQEISVQLHRRGFGISHAIGTGGRDLTSQAGGLSMLMGIDMLAADSTTNAIILTSKPPDKAVAKRVLDKAAGCGKPVVVNFFGGTNEAEMAEYSELAFADTLESAAQAIMRIVGTNRKSTASSLRSEHDLQILAYEQAHLLSQGQRYLRGLYTGGTLCYEAMLVLRDHIGNAYSNIALSSEYFLRDLSRSKEHTLIDLGDDHFTLGRAHPMIDPYLRNQRIQQEADDESVAILLLDLVLGYGSHNNPAEELAKSIETAKIRAADNGRYLIVIAAICGTEEDPQDLRKQDRLLSDAGVIVATSNAEASRIAGITLSAITENNPSRE